mmetsp:Transcript_46123/g.119293  ORF Transcript_46123/g.119293 Transcript_46123/m.119293 type:complete len:305 (-) Transcript_46123:383-1297(-)
MVRGLLRVHQQEVLQAPRKDVPRLSQVDGLSVHHTPLGAHVARHRQRVRGVGEDKHKQLLHVDDEHQDGGCHRLASLRTITPPEKGAVPDKRLQEGRAEDGLLGLRRELVRVLSGMPSVFRLSPCRRVDAEGILIDLQVEHVFADVQVDPVQLDDEGHGQAVEDCVLHLGTGKDEAHRVHAHEVADAETHHQRNERPRHHEGGVETTLQPRHFAEGCFVQPLAHRWTVDVEPADRVQHEGHVPHGCHQFIELRELQDEHHEQFEVLGQLGRRSMFRPELGRRSICRIAPIIQCARITFIWLPHT